MKPRVVLYHPVPADLKANLGERFELTALDGIAAADPVAFEGAVSNADGIIGMGLSVPFGTLSGASSLRAIATISAGYDAFDVADLTRRKIVLMNAPGALTETTADLAFLLMLGAARRVAEMDRIVRNGTWKQVFGPATFGFDVHGKTLGIVGLGRIGEAVARRGALGFGMKILYTARSAKPAAEAAFGARRCELDELLGESDFVCLAVPLSSETNKLIGARELALMKPTAIIANVARGQVIDEAALVEALQSGQVRAAGLDVYEREPLPLDSPLIGLSNVLLLPHIGSATAETRAAMARLAASNLIGFLCDGVACNVVNPEVLAGKGKDLA